MVAGVRGMIRTVHVYGPMATQIAHDHWGSLAGRRPVVLDEAGFHDCVGEIEVLLCSFPPGGAWARAQRLQLIQFVGVGVDSLFPADGLGPTVEVCNASGLSASAMGEFAVTQLLVMLKQIPEAIERQHRAQWLQTRPRTVHDRSVAVLGVGPVGAVTARLLSAFGTTVIGVTRHPRAMAHFDEVHGLAALHEVLRRVDDVVVALPATPETVGLIGRAELATLPPGGVLVNVARGSLVDDEALVDALRSGHLAGAALDAFDQEPLPHDSPWWHEPGVLVTPHVSWTSDDYVQTVADLLAENLDALERGRPLRNRVDRGLVERR